MALTLSKCRSILTQITDKFYIKGLESLATLGGPDHEIGPIGAQEFTISLYQKSNDPTPDNPAVVISGIADDTEMDVAYLKRDLEQGAAKGAGKLLLGLVACRAAELGLTLTLIAVPAKRRQRHAEKLYRFYNSAGLTRKGPEVVKFRTNGSFSTRWQNYSTSPNTLKLRYKGGRCRRTRK